MSEIFENSGQELYALYAFFDVLVSENADLLIHLAQDLHNRHDSLNGWVPDDPEGLTVSFDRSHWGVETRSIFIPYEALLSKDVEKALREYMSERNLVLSNAKKLAETTEELHQKAEVERRDRKEFERLKAKFGGEG